MSKMDDSFFRINLNRDSDFIVYSKNNLLFLPDCITLNTIDVIENPSFCSKLLAVKFSTEKRIVNAFLHSANFLSLHSPSIDCNSSNLTIFVNGSRIMRRNNVVRLDEHFFQQTPIHFEYFRVDFDNSFIHNLDYIEDLNVVETVKEFTQLNQINNEHFLTQSDFTGFINPLSGLERFSEFLSQNLFWSILIGIFTLLFVALITILLYKLPCSRICTCCIQFLTPRYTRVWQSLSRCCKRKPNVEQSADQSVPERNEVIEPIELNTYRNISL